MHMKYILIALIIILILAGVAFAVLFGLYRKTFYKRMAEPTGFFAHYMEVHPELNLSEFSCRSERGDMLIGCLLKPDADPAALIVMTHGYNLSCEDYLPLAHIFAKSGFEVLMFDGTGCGMSGGKGIYGLPQHIKDMKSVLDMVMTQEHLKDLPLLLFGHSWGGYAACCVSCLSAYPIRGILTLSAFRKSSSSMAPSIKRRFPHIASFLIATVESLEILLFGRIASATSSDGLIKADCPAKLYHSTDDAVVSYEESFDTMKKNLSDRSNITFVTLEGRNHDIYLEPKNDKKRRYLKKEIAKESDTDKKRDLTKELISLMSETDDELAKEFITFFKSCLQQ